MEVAQTSVLMDAPAHSAAFERCSTTPELNFYLSNKFSQDTLEGVEGILERVVSGLATTKFTMYGEPVGAKYTYFVYCADCNSAADYKDASDMPSIAKLPEGSNEIHPLSLNFAPPDDNSFDDFMVMTGVPQDSVFQQSRVCLKNSNCGTSGENILFIEDYGDTEIAQLQMVTTTLAFCGPEFDSFPTSYIDRNGDEQCACCAVGKQCYCPDGQIYSFEGCVAKPKKCSWNTEGYSCKWTNEKTSLSLHTDCKVTAPIPRDTYVGDKRTNSGDVDLSGPYIEITSTNKQDNSDTSAKKSTWFDFMNSPGTLEKQIAFSSFGLYDLSLTAADYKGLATCDGCIAIVDDFPPEPIKPCSTSTTGDTLDYDEDNFAAAQDKESVFTSFYSADNVKNNGVEDKSTGANKRCDVKSAQLQDFFSTTAVDLSFDTSESFDDACFGIDSFESDLMLTLKEQIQQNPISGTTDLDSLECKRCCSKSVTLKEYYYDFQCAVSTESTKQLAQGDETCSFGQCLKMPASSLISATVTRTKAALEKTIAAVARLQNPVTPSETDIHYVSPCSTEFHGGDKDCGYTVDLVDIFSMTSKWMIPDQTASASDYVFWRYKHDPGNRWWWWDSPDDYFFFNQEKTVMNIEGWSHCGLVASADFTIYVHLLNPIPDLSYSFDTMFTEIKANEGDEPSCAYLDSDFFALQFAFDSSDVTLYQPNRVTLGYFSDITCYVTLNEHGNLNEVARVEWFSAQSTPDNKLDINMEAAFELVRTGEGVQSSKETDATIDCQFTFAFYDTINTQGQKHSTTFTKNYCSTWRGDMCWMSACENPNSDLAQAFEACGGTVFSLSNSETEKRNVDRTCCDQCAWARVPMCSFVEESSLKWCDIVNTHRALMVVEESGNLAYEDALMVGVSVIGAILALILIRNRVKTATYLKIDHDAYLPLLESE